MSTVYCSNMSLLDCDSDANLIEASLPQHPTDLVLIIQFVYAIYGTGYAGCRGYMIFCVHSLGSQTKHLTLSVGGGRGIIFLVIYFKYLYLNRNFRSNKDDHMNQVDHKPDEDLITCKVVNSNDYLSKTS